MLLLKYSCCTFQNRKIGHYRRFPHFLCKRKFQFNVTLGCIFFLYNIYLFLIDVIKMSYSSSNETVEDLVTGAICGAIAFMSMNIFLYINTKNLGIKHITNEILLESVGSKHTSALEGEESGDKNNILGKVIPLNVRKTGYQLQHTHYSESKQPSSKKSTQDSNNGAWNESNSFDRNLFYNELSPYFVEVSLSDMQSAINASIGGANSIELCIDRNAGGITPSYGLIRQVVNYFLYTDIQVHVLIRPTCGDFVYNHFEFQVMLDDIDMCMNLGVDGRLLQMREHYLVIRSLPILFCRIGIVVGMLTDGGYINYQQLSELSAFVQKHPRCSGKGHLRYTVENPLQITFHRAIDVCKDINWSDNSASGVERALNTVNKLIGYGCTRLLTSGGVNKVMEGLYTVVDDEMHYHSQTVLSHLIHASDVVGAGLKGPMVVVVGSGVNYDNVGNVLKHTKAKAIHVSSCVYESFVDMAGEQKADVKPQLNSVHNEEVAVTMTSSHSTNSIIIDSYCVPKSSPMPASIPAPVAPAPRIEYVNPKIPVKPSCCGKTKDTSTKNKKCDVSIGSDSSEPEAELPNMTLKSVSSENNEIDESVLAHTSKQYSMEVDFGMNEVVNENKVRAIMNLAIHHWEDDYNRSNEN